MNSKSRKHLKLLLLFCFISSCTKTQYAPVPEIVGQWNWIYTYPSEPYILDSRLTPLNTGIQETFVYNSDLSWLKIQNNVHVDSGTYTLGKGSFRAPGDSYTFQYDSIVYYRNGVQVKEMQEYYRIYLDTLDFGKFIHDQLDDPYDIRTRKCYARKK